MDSLYNNLDIQDNIMSASLIIDHWSVSLLISIDAREKLGKTWPDPHYEVIIG